MSVSKGPCTATRPIVLGSLLALALLPAAGGAAQLRGTVSDPSGAVIPDAEVEIVSDATGVSDATRTDEFGRYLFNSLRPAAYTIRVGAPGFVTVSQANFVLRVDQQTDLDIVLEIGDVATTVEVTGQAPLLNSVSSALGQEVTNRYVTEVPLYDRNVTNLAFLAPGVTQVGGSGGQSGSQISAGQTGTNFVSNGQRNSTAEIRLDGGLTTSPETGEGSTTQAYYQPSVEAVQEFKVQNNGFSAQWGSNGGTVINIVSKSGSNEFHGSAYWFARRPTLDANNFFANRAGNPKADFKRDQYGGAVGGPIVRDRTFFFFDIDNVRNDFPTTSTATVPTALQRAGDFSQTFNQDGSLVLIHQPYEIFFRRGARRHPFPDNVIPVSQQEPVARNLMAFYPEANTAGDPVTGRDNFTGTATGSSPFRQFDIKLDHVIRANSRLAFRYSQRTLQSSAPLIYGNPADNASKTDGTVRNSVLEHTWTVNPSTVWVNRAGIDRAFIDTRSLSFDPTSIGFPDVLVNVNNTNIFPRVTANGYAPLGTNGWTDTVNAHTQWMLASSLSKVSGNHNLKIGGEVRLPLVNFWQPGFPAGWFQHVPNPTRNRVFGGSPRTGDSIASLLAGAGHPFSWGGLSVAPSMATRSQETAFYAQDDWRVTQRLTFNLGLRYEWSTPLTERHNRVQFAEADVDSGVSVEGLGPLRGVNVFASPGRRRPNIDANNIAPRFGLAYKAGGTTVIRGGFGVYYGVSPATNTQYSGPAFRSSAVWQPTRDFGFSPYATLSNPYPDGVPLPQGDRYGSANQWGYESSGALFSEFRNAEIYQWSIGVQQELPGQMVLEFGYSGSRSTHLMFNGTDNQNFVSRETREQYGSEGLFEEVPNPFLPLFQGPQAIFREASSAYNGEEIPRINLLRPFPQFDGPFAGSHQPRASARYDALQIRTEKRYSNGLNFVGSYSYSRLRDDSSAGNNSWLGNRVPIQDPTNLSLEHGLGGSDTPHRLVFGWSYELPVGRGRSVGRSWSPGLDAVFGGWQINGFLTFQSGLPLGLTYDAPELADGSQRPNLSGPILGAEIDAVVDGRGIRFDESAFSAPPPQTPGNAERWTGEVRGDTVNNLDLSIFKVLTFTEDVRLQIRAEFFNFANTPQFGPPNTSFGSPDFGTINSQINSARQFQFGLRLLF